jgi:hypothetical protein
MNSIAECTPAASQVDSHQADFTKARLAYWEEYASTMGRWTASRKYYREQIEQIYQLLIPPGMRILARNEAGNIDADLTVPPEDLPRFYQAWRSGTGDFINGVRLVYPMEKKAMQFFKLIANKCFGLAFTWLLGQSVRDTLCGTKVLSRKHYEIIAANRNYFGELDPFGDFDLLFGAARFSMKLVDLPIRYRERKYGETNIQRWKHGWLLSRMVGLASRRLRFV